MGHKNIVKLFKKNWITMVLLCSTDTHVLDFRWWLTWVSKPGWIPSLACFVACTMDPSYSPLVWHMLSSWQPAWWTRHFNLQIYTYTSIGGAQIWDRVCHCLTDCVKRRTTELGMLNRKLRYPVSNKHGNLWRLKT